MLTLSRTQPLAGGGRVGRAARAAPCGVPAPARARANARKQPGLPRSLPSPGVDYDWRAQWYPVAYSADLPLDSPVQVWLFDSPVAVARRSGGRPPMAFEDSCPHRRAALSEGRVTAAGLMQCAYHGHTFDAVTGACVGIPHLPGGRAGGGPPAATPALTPATSSARTCAVALPCMEAEGMVWVAPTAGGPPPATPPVGIRELAGPDAGRWATADFVRSFPVDAALILENLCDPDHGLAHQTLSLDAFSAGGPDGKRMTVVPATGRGGGLHLVGTVPATPVLGLAAAAAAAATKQKKKKEKQAAGAPTTPPATATLEFEAPGFVRWGRVGPAGQAPSFLATFWVVPEGVGRCRLFVRYARSFGVRLPVPRWLVAVGLLHFLDQDTFLVASQQRDVLGAEAAAVAAADRAQAGVGAGEGEGGGTSPAPPPPPQFKRAAVLAYRNPSEVFLAALGRWLDGALPRQPNRAAGLRAGVGLAPLPREVVLDRWAGHTAFVPSSRAVHDRAAAAAAVLKVVSLVSLAVVAASLAPGGALAGAGRARVAAWAALPAATAVAARGAAWLASRFKYCFTREEQVRDLRRIADLAPGVEGVV